MKSNYRIKGSDFFLYVDRAVRRARQSVTISAVQLIIPTERIAR